MIHMFWDVTAETLSNQFPTFRRTTNGVLPQKTIVFIETVTRLRVGRSQFQSPAGAKEFSVFEKCLDWLSDSSTSYLVATGYF
jgi:hypothetical protein